LVFQPPPGSIPDTGANTGRETQPHGQIVMGMDYQSLVLDYRRSADQDAVSPVTHPVVVVGAGPVGLTLAIDLAQRGIPVVLLDDSNRLSHGSRAICFAKRSLEIFDRLGCGQRLVDKGISWNVGKVFFQDELAYSFNLLPEAGHQRPAFINLQQYYVEGYLADHAAALGNLDIRWLNKVVATRPQSDHVEIAVETPEGPYTVQARYLVACDGARSAVRSQLGLESRGRVFNDRFLIADVKMTAPFPTERWFWFDPPFHRNQSVLLHRQPDDVWRIDFQLGRDADPEIEKQPERVIPRIRALLGDDVDFTLEWVSVYTFACSRMERFRHGRVFFAGDSAHGVSPFGARGANSGVQDADNLAWKLALFLGGQASDPLLDSYASEREYAADENILNSTRATDFISPTSAISRTFRDATLQLAKDYAFARRFVNSGRLSVPAVLRESPLNTPDSAVFAGSMVPGAPAADAPVWLNGRDGWFLGQLGRDFTLLHFSDTSLALPDMLVPVTVLRVGADALEDSEGLLAQRYDAQPGTVYLLRPDQHVCARWRHCDAEAVRAALDRALRRI
jgi:3-(3-hydroxy-phenyl)propionate hydroxylase